MDSAVSWSSAVDWSRRSSTRRCSGQGLDVRALGVLIVLLLVARFTEWGRVLAHHRRLLRRAREPGCGWCRGTAPVGQRHRRPRQRAVLGLLRERPVLGALQVAFQGSDSRRMRRSATASTPSGSQWAYSPCWQRRFLIRRLIDLYPTWASCAALASGRTRRARRVDGRGAPTRAYHRKRGRSTTATSAAGHRHRQYGRNRRTNARARPGGHRSAQRRFQVTLSVALFGVILWHLSGPLTVPSLTIPAKGAVLRSSSPRWRPRSSCSGIGRPKELAEFSNEMRNATFRYAMISTRRAPLACTAAVMRNEIGCATTAVRISPRTGHGSGRVGWCCSW